MLPGGSKPPKDFRTMARGISHREWRIYRDDHTDDLGRVDEQGFRAAIQAELAMCENLGERLGVAIVAAPIRTRLNGGGSWFTVGWVFKTATVPAAREDEVTGAFDDLPEVDEITVPDTLPEVE
jgi:hypothetical protein